MRAFVNYTDPGGASFLASRAPCFVGELFTVTLTDGTIYRWTSYDRSLNVGVTKWFAPIDGSPLVTCNRFGTKNTIEVPELEIRLADTPYSGAFVGSLISRIHNGIFDGARVEMARVFMPTPGDTKYGYVAMFEGRASGPVIDAEGITLTAKGDNVLMNQQAPRNLYQTNCRHTFCDAGCTLLAADYTFTGRTIGAGTTAHSIAWTVPGGFSASDFNNGKVTMTSGPAIGQVRTVRFAAGSALALTYPFYNAPQPGDTFSILMGCGKQLTDCQTRKPAAGGTVDNSQNFAAEPFTPQAEIAV
jgi:uncharacterized phage protein (TIGR02218 family)